MQSLFFLMGKNHVLQQSRYKIKINFSLNGNPVIWKKGIALEITPVSKSNSKPPIAAIIAMT
ncbi:hypothetical protein EZS27_015400 [termite gut metagenome]|uniref:Uncharacterized protein n=1 Tax=termite gut metagenome TaxID=433724 RepID=A0A5J4RR44_9ZZZZ